MFSPGLRKDRGCRNHNGRQKSRGNMPNVGVGWYSESLLLWADAEIQIRCLDENDSPWFEFTSSMKCCKLSIQKWIGKYELHRKQEETMWRIQHTCIGFLVSLTRFSSPNESCDFLQVALSIRDAHSSCTTQRCTTTDAKTVQKFATWVRVDSWMFFYVDKRCWYSQNT